MTATPEKWAQAREHLEQMIVVRRRRHREPNVGLGRCRELLARYESGERTEALLRAMMEAE